MCVFFSSNTWRYNYSFRRAFLGIKYSPCVNYARGWTTANWLRDCCSAWVDEVERITTNANVESFLLFVQLFRYCWLRYCYLLIVVKCCVAICFSFFLCCYYFYLLLMVATMIYCKIIFLKYSQYFLLRFKLSLKIVEYANENN